MPRGSRKGVEHAQRFRWPSWEERYWSHVDTSPGHGPNGDCHLWTGCGRGTPTNYYGVITIEGKVHGVHRVAFFLKHGHWPLQLALHKCDVKLCVNPDHIYDGSHSDNMKDARNRGLITHYPTPTYRKRRRGVRHPNARFTNAQVRNIRQKYTDGMTVAELAHRYGSPWPTIDWIVKRRTWRHVK